MNTMTTALKEAGIPMPSVYERIWRFFKDNPRSTSAACSRVMSISRGSVSSYISEMETRRMLRSERVSMRIPGSRGSVCERHIKHYYVNTNQFEMLPKPKRLKSQRKHKIEKTPVVVDLSRVKRDPAPPQPATAFDLDKLTVAEARNLYAELKKMFG